MTDERRNSRKSDSTKNDTTWEQTDVWNALDLTWHHLNDIQEHHGGGCGGDILRTGETATQLTSKCQECGFFVTSTLHTVGWVDGRSSS